MKDINKIKEELTNGGNPVDLLEDFTKILQDFVNEQNKLDQNYIESSIYADTLQKLSQEIKKHFSDIDLMSKDDQEELYESLSVMYDLGTHQVDKDLIDQTASLNVYGFLKKMEKKLFKRK